MMEISLWRSRIGLFVPGHRRCSSRVCLVVVGRDGGGSGRPCLAPVCVLVMAAVLLIGGDIETNPGPLGKRKHGTPELPSLFRSNYYRLCKNVSGHHDDITPLANLFYASGFITDGIRLAVQHTPALTPDERATRLLDPAVKVAQESLQEAKKFCECLQECGIPVPENILEELEMSETKPSEKSKHHFKEVTRTLQVATDTTQTESSLKSAPLPEKVQVYQNYLKAVYQKDKFPVYYKFPEHLKVDCYIKLALVHKSMKKKDSPQDLTLKLCGQIEKLSSRGKRVPLRMSEVGYVGAERTLARRILIEGSPGIGKTTFAWELCRQWQCGSTLKEYDMVVLLRCRDKAVQEAKSLYDLLYHMREDVRKAVHEYISDHNGEGLLLLLEGYDELPVECLSDSFVCRLLTSEDFPCATVLVTSRPITHRNLPVAFLHSLHQHIEILGFSESDIKDYITVACPSQWVTVKFQQYLSLHPFIKSAMFVPLQCAVITDLYIERCEAGEEAFAPHTFTQLYRELIQTHMLRYMSTNSKYKNRVSQVRCLEDLPKELYEGLLHLAKLAAEGIEKQRYTFPGEGLAEHFGLMQRVESLNPSRATSVVFCFHHLTLQEFLASLFWSRLPSKELTTLLTTSKLFPLQKLVEEGMKEDEESTVHHWPVLMFVAGLTQLKGIPAEVITDSFDLDDYVEPLKSSLEFSASLCHVLFEAQSPDLVFNLFAGKLFSPKFRTTLDCYVFGYCISRSSSTATWEVRYDHNLGHKPEHIKVLIKGLSSFHCSREPCGCISELNLCSGSDLPKCLQLLPNLIPYTSNLTALNVVGNLPSEECGKFAHIVQNHYSKLTYFGLVTSNTAADYLELISSLSQLSHLEELHLGFSDSDAVQIPPQKMNKVTSMVIWVSYTLSLHESLIIPNNGSLEEIYLVNCNMAKDCMQALAAFLQSPNSNIKDFRAYCCTFGDNFSMLATSLASTKSVKALFIVGCNVGMEGVQFLAQACKQMNTIDDVTVIDETITVQGAQLLLNVLAGRKDCELTLHTSFEEQLNFTGQEQVKISFDDGTDVVDLVKTIVQCII